MYYHVLDYIAYFHYLFQVYIFGDEFSSNDYYDDDYYDDDYYDDDDYDDDDYDDDDYDYDYNCKQGSEEVMVTVGLNYQDHRLSI